MSNEVNTLENSQVKSEAPCPDFQKPSANEPLIHPAQVDINGSPLVPRKASSLEEAVHDQLQKRVKTAADEQVQRLVYMNAQKHINPPVQQIYPSSPQVQLNQALAQGKVSPSVVQDNSVKDIVQRQLDILIQQKKYEEQKEKEVQLLSQHVKFLASIKADREKARQQAAAFWSFPLNHAKNMVDLNKNNIEKTLDELSASLLPGVNSSIPHHPLGGLSFSKQTNVVLKQQNLVTSLSLLKSAEPIKDSAKEPKEPKEPKIREDDPGSPGKPLTIDCPDPPTLAEITKEYPNWDLTTIFSYAKSGKTPEEFRRQKQRIKEKRKINIQAAKNRSEEQNNTIHPNINTNMNLNTNFDITNLLLPQYQTNLNKMFWPH